jgi:hypothetical protein
MLGQPLWALHPGRSTPGSQAQDAEQEEFLRDLVRMNRGPGMRLTQTSVFDGEFEIPLVRVSLGDPGTGWPETFLFHAPAQQTPRPMLVAFHSFARSENEIILETRLVQESADRDWYLLAPLSANKRHYSSMPAQLNTEAAIQWMLTHFPGIDRTRIYGIGFSMGGGMVTSYAARHLDPTDHMFAAIVDHTGTVSLKNTWEDEPASRFFLNFWYGEPSGTPAAYFGMARCSVLDFDGATQVVNADNAMARNLLHMGVRNTRALNDPLAYLVEQAEVFNGFMISLGAQLGASYDYRVLPSSQHYWNLLNYSVTLNWLSQFSLSLPAQANTLADSDRRYFYFDVVQESAGAFTPFSWSIDVAENRVRVHSTSNLLRIRVDTDMAGLDPALPLSIELGTVDGLPDEVSLSDYPAPPITVERDGIPTSAWTYNALLAELTLQELDGSAHTWVVTP